MRRFTNSLSITRDLNTPIVMSWRETRAPGNANILPGRVTTIGRLIDLDASALPPGDYWLEIVMQEPGSSPVRSRRGFSIK